ncbi:MAG: hypothetical protein M3176_19540 [Chloroflexota bacterium]|nr:hypothetical protein [Chloroflexota bacterium]
MYPRRIGLSLHRHLIGRMACLAAIALLLVFTTAVSAATPEASGVTATITTGSVPASNYGYFPGYLPYSYTPGYTDGVTCGGLYGCPFAAPPFGYGTTYVRGNLYCGLYTCGVVQTIQR